MTQNNLKFFVKLFQPEHKIQSDSGPLTLKMEQVPKMISPLVKDWAPNAFVVSFKVMQNIVLNVTLID